MSGSKDEIMEAAFKALCKHGYADLSIQKIAEESEKGKSSIYYHFDDKEDLMLSFMDGMVEEMRSDYHGFEECSPEERLEKLLEVVMGTEEERWKFNKAFQEFSVKAGSDEQFAEKIREMDQALIEQLEDILEDMGVERPVVRAEILASAIEGAVNRKVSTGDREGLNELRSEIEGMADEWS